MKKSFLKKGFTLIELLVVIAIIGILSGIVLTSLNSARGKASDSAAKADMANIRAQAELFYDTNSGSYGASAATCSAANTVFTDSVITQAIAHITTSASAPVCNTSSDGQKWAMSIPTFKSGTTGGWCVDNSGWNKAGVAAAGVCVVAP